MIAYRFLQPAEEEMIEAAQFYEAAASGLGRDFLDDLQHGINHLHQHPNLGHSVAHSLRRLLLHRFPFSLIYSVDIEGVLIVAVAHHGRRPGYWKNRVRTNSAAHESGKVNSSRERSG